MTADKERSYRPPLSKKLPELLPEISLRHGQAIWLLTELGFGGDATQATFYEYIKSLRKLGIPFDNRAVGTTRGGAVKYSYQNLMELALALTLRVYYVVPDSVLVGIIQYRRSLYGHYRRAYAERCTGKGAPIAHRRQSADLHARRLLGSSAEFLRREARQIRPAKGAFAPRCCICVRQGPIRRSRIASY